MKQTAAALVAQAHGRIESVTPHEAADELAAGATVLIDVREADELSAHGRIPGSTWVPRGLLEFRSDPASPRHQAGLEPGRRVILHSERGERSALAAATLRDMGYVRVAHLDGGITAWKEAGKPTV